MDQNPDPKPKATPIDLTKATPRSRGMLDPMLILKWNSRKGEVTSLAAQLMMDINVDADKGSSRPDLLHLSDWGENSTDEMGDIAARPTKEKGSSTVSVRWAKKGLEGRIDFQRLLLVRHFPIPRGQRALIPVGRDKDANDQHVLIFKFSEAKFALIEPRPSRSKKQQAASAKKPEAPQPPPQAASGT